MGPEDPVSRPSHQMSYAVLLEFSFCPKEGTQWRKLEYSRRQKSHIAVHAQRRAAQDNYPTALDWEVSKNLPFVVLGHCILGIFCYTLHLVLITLINKWVVTLTAVLTQQPCDRQMWGHFCCLEALSFIQINIVIWPPKSGESLRLCEQQGRQQSGAIPNVSKLTEVCAGTSSIASASSTLAPPQTPCLWPVS